MRRAVTQSIRWCADPSLQRPEWLQSTARQTAQRSELRLIGPRRGKVLPPNPACTVKWRGARADQHRSLVTTAYGPICQRPRERIAALVDELFAKISAQALGHPVPEGPRVTINGLTRSVSDPTVTVQRWIKTLTPVARYTDDLQRVVGPALRTRVRRRVDRQTFHRQQVPRRIGGKQFRVRHFQRSRWSRNLKTIQRPRARAARTACPTRRTRWRTFQIGRQDFKRRPRSQT